MKFSEYKYVRPSFDEYKAKLNSFIDALNSAEKVEEAIKIIDEANALRMNVQTMQVLQSIRHTINNNDEFYNGEDDYWNENGPLYANEENKLAKAIMESKHLAGLKEHYPSTYFGIMEAALKSMDEKIIPEMIEENKLVSQYNRIKATAQIQFDGGTYTLPGMAAFAVSNDRDTRKRANDAICAFYESHEAEIDEIYDKLVKIRDQKAKKLGYNNYVELGYVNMCRLDYNKDDVANYRKQILESITPLVGKLRETQRQNLGLAEMKYYDEAFEFASGNPKPQGSPEWIIDEGLKMYHELSKETGEFFDFMTSHELLDLLSKDGKEGGGYCTFIDDYDSPFIFSNFNGTKGDIEVLTHEAGHAFQIYSSRTINVPECKWPTMESCEIHSMSMEFLTYPWMKNFFKQDIDKYFYSHLTGTFTFLPYGVLVDHFQHEVYEHPEMTPQERKATWRNLEKMYIPTKNYEGCDFYERGNWWFKQSHIFASPFYYIDYTLAQVCAHQFYIKSLDNYEKAWEDYLRLCKLGGTKSFLGLVEAANLKNPFKDGTIQMIVDKLTPKIEEFAKGDIK